MNRIASFLKSAGEIKFIKDKGNDTDQWAYSNEHMSKRELIKNHAYKAEQHTALEDVLNKSMEALEAISGAYNVFAKLKSVDISPDGSLGGKGYIMKIIDMRKQYMNIIEALSSMTDTIHDELESKHWQNIKVDRKRVQEEPSMLEK